MNKIDNSTDIITTNDQLISAYMTFIDELLTRSCDF